METPGITSPLPDCWVVGHGLLGAALAASLRSAGTRVLTLDLLAPADVVGDAADEAVLQRSLQRLVPQVVFCCQATGGGTPADYRRAYGDVVQQLTALNLRVVFCSSVSVYGAVSGAVDEAVQPVGASERAQILLDTEDAVRRSGGIVLRLAALYGAGRCEVLRRHLAGEPRLPGNADRFLSYVHTDDAVSALILAAQKAVPGSCLNVCGESVQHVELYRQLTEATGVLPSEETTPASRRGLSDRLIDCARLRELGWKPQMSLRRFAEHFADTIGTNAP